MLDKLQEMVRQYSNDDRIVITGETVLLTDLGLNSYDLVELVCEVEDKFGIEIPERAIGNIKTIQNLMDFIESAI